MPDSLPTVLFHRILKYCLPSDFCNLRSVSTYCHRETASVVQFITKKLLDRYYPSRSIEEFSSFRSQIELIETLRTVKLIMLRGFLAYSLNMSSGVWRRLHDSRRDRGYFSLVVDRGEILAVGTNSVVATGTCERYDPITRSWHVVASLPRKLQSVCAAVLDHRVYVLGGIDKTVEEVSREVFVLHRDRDPQCPDSQVEEHWHPAGVELLRPRYRHAAIGFQGKIWVAGGRLEDHMVTNSVEVLDPATGATTGPSMNIPRDFANLLVVQGRLYAVGGDRSSEATERHVTRTIEVLAPDGLTWTHVTDFKDHRRGFAPTAHGSRIFVFAGCEGCSAEHPATQTWDAFDVVTGLWDSQVLPPDALKMPSIESWGQAVTFPDDRVGW